MGFSLILRAFFSFPNERQFIECQFFWEFRIGVCQGIPRPGVTGQPQAVFQAEEGQ